MVGEARMMHRSQITEVLECQTEGIHQWGNTEGFLQRVLCSPFMNLKWYNSDVESDQVLKSH